jgi:hypothetical protein
VPIQGGIYVRLLVSEDDPDLNRQWATALTDAGYVVDRAFDGEKGPCLGKPYDAVILDVTASTPREGVVTSPSWAVVPPADNSERCIRGSSLGIVSSSLSSWG